MVCGMAGCSGVWGRLFRGLNTSLDMLLGGAVVLLPTLWVAMSLTSGRSIFGPVWLGSPVTLAGVGFAALFAVRPNSHPLAVLAGSGAALVLPSVLLFWRQRSGESDKSWDRPDMGDASFSDNERERAQN